MFSEIWLWLALVIAAYLLGSIPSAIWVGKWFYQIDIREHGSKNAGATNTIRVLGWRAGIPVLIIDILKGWLSVSLIKLFSIPQALPIDPDMVRISLALSVVIGHVFPVFAGFRGGKGMATLLGVGIALYPLAVMVAAVIFFFTLAITGYVSLSSITAAISFPVLVFFLFNPHSAPLLVLSVLVGIFIPVTHRRNIQRLLHKEEPKFYINRKNKP